MKRNICLFTFAVVMFLLPQSMFCADKNVSYPLGDAPIFISSQMKMKYGLDESIKNNPEILKSVSLYFKNLENNFTKFKIKLEERKKLLENTEIKTEVSRDTPFKITKQFKIVDLDYRCIFQVEAEGIFTAPVMASKDSALFNGSCINVVLINDDGSPIGTGLCVCIHKELSSVEIPDGTEIKLVLNIPITNHNGEAMSRFTKILLVPDVNNRSYIAGRDYAASLIPAKDEALDSIPTNGKISISRVHREPIIDKK